MIWHILLIIFWTICSFETGRLIGRMNYRKQIKRMKQQLIEMIGNEVENG